MKRPSTGDLSTALRNAVLPVTIMRRACPASAATAAFLTVVSAGLGTLAMIASGRTVGAISEAVRRPTSASTSHAIWWGAAFLCSVILTPIVESLITLASTDSGLKFERYVQLSIAEIGLAPDTLDALDQPSLTADIRALLKVSRTWRLADAVKQIWPVAAIRLTATSSIVIVAMWCWWVPIIILPVRFLSARVSSSETRNRRREEIGSEATGRRRAEYFRSLLIDPGPAKEVRLFGLQNYLAEHRERLWQGSTKLLWRSNFAHLRKTLLIGALDLAVLALAFLKMGWDAYNGTISVSTIVTTIAAVVGLAQFGPLGEIQDRVTALVAAVQAVADTRRSVGLTSFDRPTSLTTFNHPRPSRPSIAGTSVGGAQVCLQRVTFTYPTRTTPTLRDFSLVIEPGQSVAFVGANGAGKTTLIKLIAGIYRPDSGLILVDGKPDRPNGRIALIQQNFVRYPLTLRENVGYGSQRTLLDDDELRRVLRRAGAEKIVDDSPHGLDTILSPEFTHGVDLSGGQWQRIAMARAIAALDDGAGLLILDEPTASLDVDAEIEFYNNFLEIAGHATVILATHRLSSVRKVDRIIVLDPLAGNILEDGPHSELVDANGPYSQLWRAQAGQFLQKNGMLSGD